VTKHRVAMCPYCDLPHAELMRLGDIDIVGTTCATDRPMCWSWPVRAVPMTENHDPGDEHDGGRA
jgi:hypothetical protein